MRPTKLGNRCPERSLLTIVRRETRSDPGEGLVTRISPDREPQWDDFRNFYEEPDIRVNSALIQSLGSRWPNNVDSDDSEDDECCHKRNVGHFRMMDGHWWKDHR